MEPGGRRGAGAGGAQSAGWAEGGVMNRCWLDSAVVTSLRSKDGCCRIVDLRERHLVY
jgi:hypothetical protein